MSLTGQQLEAAAHIAVGELTDRQIAEKLGVTDRTLRNWKGLPAFVAEIGVFREEAKAAALRISIANREDRLKRLDKRWNDIDALITERGADPNHIGVPGFGTGLLCHEQKSVGGGEIATITDIYRSDTALLKEERELAKQAAIETGQWQEKSDVTSGGKPLEGPSVVIYIPSNGRDQTSAGATGSVPDHVG